MTEALLVEAFTAEPCRGNGAAVVLLEQPVRDAWMQQLARSLRQSETAFLLPRQEHWQLRWFTPTCEVPLCGHATLASLLALEHWQRLGQDRATVFATRSGALQARLRPDGLGEINLPTTPLLPDRAPDYLGELLQRHSNSTCQGFWRSALGYSVALLDDTAEIERCPVLAPWLQPQEATGLVVMQGCNPEANKAAIETAASGAVHAHYRLRFFAPGMGIDEDPVTGSAHALVAPYWMDKLDRDSVVGWQCSPSPGGMVCDRGSSGMIRLAGAGVVLWDGSLNLNSETCAASASRWLEVCAIG